MKKAVKYLLLFLLPTVVSAIGIFIITHSKKPTIVHNAAVPRDGYETMPEQYNVEASPWFTWENGGHLIILVVLGFVLYAAGPTYAYILTRKVENPTWHLFALSWVGGACCIFLKFEFTDFAKTIDAATYLLNQANIENIFK